MKSSLSNLLQIHLIELSEYKKRKLCNDESCINQTLFWCIGVSSSNSKGLVVVKILDIPPNLTKQKTMKTFV